MAGLPSIHQAFLLRPNPRAVVGIASDETIQMSFGNLRVLSVRTPHSLVWVCQKTKIRFHLTQAHFSPHKIVGPLFQTTGCCAFGPTQVGDFYD